MTHPTERELLSTAELADDIAVKTCQLMVRAGLVAEQRIKICAAIRQTINPDWATPQPAAPDTVGSEIDPEELDQTAITWTLDRVAKILGVDEWYCDGASETVEGDVDHDIYGILKSANIYSDEDGTIARLATQPAVDSHAAEKNAPASASNGAPILNRQEPPANASRDAQDGGISSDSHAGGEMRSAADIYCLLFKAFTDDKTPLPTCIRLISDVQQDAIASIRPRPKDWKANSEEEGDAYTYGYFDGRDDAIASAQSPAAVRDAALEEAAKRVEWKGPEPRIGSFMEMHKQSANEHAENILALKSTPQQAVKPEGKCSKSAGSSTGAANVSIASTHA